MEQLKPCPFCGGNHALEYAIDALTNEVVADDDVRDAIEYYEQAIDFRKTREPETRKHYGGELPSWILKSNKMDALAIKSLRHMRKEPYVKRLSCWYCAGIESHGIVVVKTVEDECGNELSAQDTPYNYCPNCGRKLVTE